MTTPQAAVLDHFTGTSGVALSSYSGNWAAESGVATVEPTIGSDASSARSNGSTASADYWTSSFSQDCEAFFTVKALPSAALTFAVGLDLRLTNPTNSGTVNRLSYSWSYSAGGTDTYQLFKVVAGTGTLLQQFSTSGHNLATGDKLWVRSVGNQHFLYRYISASSKWERLISVVDSTITGAGFVGIFINGNTNTRVTDFGAGNVSASAGYIGQVVYDSPIGLWEHAEPSGTTATDYSGASDGTYSGTGITLGQTGLPGGGGATAARLTAASTGTVTIPVTTVNSVTDVLSVEMWVKRVTTGGSGQVLFGAHTGGGHPLIIYFTSGNTIAVDAEDSVNLLGSSIALTDTSSWHHIVFTKNGSTRKLYIDATDVSSGGSNATLDPTNSSYILGVGQGSGHTSLYLDGYLAMSAIYQVALTSGQVSTHYALGIASGLQHNLGLMNVGS